ncbi:MAG: nucleotide exchange factor GrpE [Firmicutes bacterium]|jgi:molecular chaperone GrpE|nr:nucleotide exchange factor GrpE [Bacillota bacterium]
MSGGVLVMTDERNRPEEEQHNEALREEPTQKTPPEVEGGKQSPDAPSSPEEQGPSVAERLSQAEAKANENWDLYLRARADFENYQRRTERHLAASIRAGKKDLILRILAVVDDFERAIAAQADRAALVEGIQITLRKLMAALAAEGVEPIEAVGKPFDPCLHEAVAACDDPAVTVETVVDELLRGYTYEGELLRPTLARVARPNKD